MLDTFFPHFIGFPPFIGGDRILRGLPRSAMLVVLDFWNALARPPKLTRARKELGAIMRGEA